MKKHSLIMCLFAAMCLPLMHAHAQRKGAKINVGATQNSATPGRAQTGGTTTTGSAGAVLLGSAANTATNSGALKRKPVETFIAHVRTTNTFVPVSNIWVPDNQYDKTALLRNVEVVQPLTIDYNAVANLVRSNHTAISLVIPGVGGTTHTIELAQYNPLSNDFKVIAHNGRGEDKVVAFTPGKYYSGVVKDVPGSVAAFSFFNGEVHGIFSIPGVGNIVVTPNTLAGANYNNERYVIYNDRDLKNMQMAGCGSDKLPSHDAFGTAAKTTTTLNNNIYNNCKQIRLMSIADFATYVAQGNSVPNVATYLTSIFNNKAVLYRNEGVLLEFKVLQVNTATDEYAGLANSSIKFLTMLGGVVQNTFKTTHNCDVAQLFSTKYSNIGGVAWLPGLCLNYDASDSSGSYAFSGLSGSTATFPTYSWNVEVSTHELGHVLGSWHTHACVWGPARTTAIDGCYTIEGGCADPGDPSGAVGGTIMSYCHLVGGVGINFSNGFGTQPGDTIRYRIGIQGASCGTQYNPSVALPIASRTVTANRECKDLTSGRTYYWYDANTASENDDTLVLIINKGTNSIGDLNTGLTVTANTIAGYGGGTGQSITFPGGTSGVQSNNISMRRYWNISGATTPAGAVEVLYPFLGTDTADVKGSVPSSTLPTYRVYKVNSPISPNPAGGFSGAVAGDFTVFTNSVTPSANNWALTNIGNTLLARMNMTNLNGGGTAFFTFSGNISGNTTVCVTATTQLSTSGTGGVWSSDNTTVATVDGTGLVTGVSAGTANISYTIGGTPSTALVTVVGAPGAFGGLTTVCAGSSIVVSNATGGGAWSSQTSSVATVNSATRTVFGASGGVAVIKYSTGCGTDGTLSITVTPTPGTIQGPSAVCVGAMIFMSNAVTGGAWSATSTHVSVSPTSGDVLGLTAGNTVIKYSTGCGTDASKTVTINAAPGAIGGPTTVCQSSTITLTNSVAGGVWTSSNTTIITINSATRVVTGVGPGTANIIYSTGCGSDASVAITVNPSPGVIQGPSSVCVGAMIFMSNAVTGGAWSATTTHVSVSPTSGDVLGLTAGTTVIKYSTGCGTDASKTVTVTAAPGVIGGPTTVCQGSGITLTNSVAGGTWTSSNTSVATINSATRVVTGVSAGTVNIVYSTGCGSNASLTVTVVATPGAIQGASTVCVGNSISMSNAVTGGTWSSASTHLSVSPTGVVTGMTAGTTVVKYSTGCGTEASKTVTVNAAPAAIGGPTTVCQGSGITLTNSVAGGVWTSSNTSVATVNSATRVVTGVSAGTANIIYSTGCGSNASLAVTVIAAPGAIQGASTVCVGSSISMSNAVTGGTWSSTTTNVSVSPTGVVTGMTAGTAVIKYATGCGTDASKTVTVRAAPGAISGATEVCTGLTIALSNATPGGTWFTAGGNATVVAGTGVVTGVSGGSATIVYSTGCGSDANQLVTVNATPSPITGTLSVMAGTTTALSSTTSGGVWSSTNTARATVDPSTGLVTGVTTGTAQISYTNASGCAAVVTVTVTSSFVDGYTVCIGQTVTMYDGGDPGGTWTSGNASIATVELTTGVATGLGVGTAIMYYIHPGGTMTATLTVNPLSPTTGLSSLCVGSSITLTNTTPGGGVWSSDNTTTATVDAAGVVTGAGPGNSIITFTSTAGCSTTHIVEVSGAGSIDGATSVCTGQTIALSNTVGGGAWSSSNASLATVSAGGVVTGVAAGTVRISYILGTGCQAVTTVTVNQLYSVLGNSSVCQGSTIALSNTTPGGGMWSSDNTASATINSSGLLTATGAGVAVVSFTANATGCVSTRTITVSTSGTVSGPTSVCIGQSIALSNSIGGGAWSSSNGSQATVSGAGVVSGVSAGTVRISYIVGGCQSVATVTVSTLQPITGGTSSICQGGSMTLVNTTVGGGVWSSGNTAIAVISSGGVVTGTGGGVVTISFTANNACVATKTITVTAAPSVTGNTSLCAGQTTQLSNGGVAGAWSSSSAAFATVTSTGLVTGVSAGTVRITFMGSTGCMGVATLTVNSLAQIVGSASVCQGQAITLTNSTAGGGVWSSANSAVATVNGSGVVTGAGAGSTSILFTSTVGGCVATKTVTVIGSGTISGNLSVCVGQSSALSVSVGGGNWSTSSNAQATISAAGVLWGVSASTPRVSYIWPTGCQAIATVTVNALMQTTGGTTGMCASGTMLLSNLTPGGGVWTTSNTTIATVNATGTVKGVSPGVVRIFFTAGSSCVATRTVIVNSCRQSGGSSSGTSVATTVDVVTEVQLFPNPNNGIFTLTGNVNDEAVTQVDMEIINAVGQVVYRNSAPVQNGRINEHVDIGRSAASGNYLLRVRTDQGSSVFRFIVGQ